jgi:hypothetical protein
LLAPRCHEIQARFKVPEREFTIWKCYGALPNMAVFVKCTDATMPCRIQARLKIPEEEFAKWKWGIRATVHSPMRSLDDPAALVAAELEAMRGKVIAVSNVSNPTICMVHENKIPGGRRTAGTYGGYEAQIRMQ